MSARAKAAAAIVSTACLWLSACGAQEASVARMSRLAAPRVEEFANFERWVHRAHDGAASLSGPELVAEAAFSPIRNREHVLAAAIDLNSGQDEHMVFPGEARIPGGLVWVSVRAEPDGALQVAELPDCGLDLPQWWRKDVARRCVLISRTSSRGIADQLTVTMAFGY